jgi:DNA-binding transcriptional LysR family regulator
VTWQHVSRSPTKAALPAARLGTSQSALSHAIRRLETRLDLRIELHTNGGQIDIVSEKFDAGVRLGKRVAKDMIAVRIGPPYTMAIIAAPAYWAEHGKPETPQDLARHACIDIRFPTTGGLYAWELEQGGREINVRVDRRLVLNNMPLIVDAAVSDLGVAFAIDDQVAAQLAEGSLVRVMQNWCAPFAGYHLYYPSRRQLSPAMALLVDTLRFTG